MSGHANFHAINGAGPKMPVNPQIGGNQDVAPSMSVGGVNAPNATDAVEHADENVQLQPNAGAEEAKRLVRQLDVLLVRAAESATKGVDANAVKEALKGVALSKADRKMLNAVADKADAAYKAINEFTGRQLAFGVEAKDGKFDWAGNPAGEAIRKALDAQAELSDLLRQVVSQIPGGATAATLEDALMQCDRRACEIQTLVCQFADLLEKGEPEDPAVSQRLNQTLAKLLPQQALQMHGNDAALAAMKESVAPLAERLDTLAKTQGASLSKDEISAIGREIDQMANALDGAVKSGVAGKSGIGVDRTLFAAAKELLGEVRGKLTNARQDISQASLLNFADKVFSPVPVALLDPKFLPILRPLAPRVAAFVEARADMHRVAREYAKDPTEEKFSELNAIAMRYSRMCTEKANIKDEMVALTLRVTTGESMEESTVKALASAVGKARYLSDADRADSKKLFGEFAKILIPFALQTLPEPDKSPDIKRTLAFVGTAYGILSQVAHLKLMHTAAERMGDADFVTSDTVHAAFEGKLRFTTLVEARLHGLSDGDVDPKLDDVNHVSSKKLGSGAMNTVYEVGYKDGSAYIFKPESPGRQSFDKMTLAYGTKAAQMIAQLNIASQKAAESLGLTDVMAKTTVGFHKGHFGIFMEKAKGVDAVVFRRSGIATGVPKGDLSAMRIKKLPDEQYAKVVGAMMRKANRLDWFDMITGQGDRHAHNFMVSVSKEDLSVTLKAIDNDSCFTLYQTGIRTFKMSPEKSAIFKKLVEFMPAKLYPAKWEGEERKALLKELMADPGMTIDRDGTITLDATKIKSPIMHFCLQKTYGLHSTALPDYIDKALYDNLMALAEPGPRRDKYIADLTANLPKEARDVAILRLDNAIAHAKALDAKGHVVSEDEWNMKGKQREIAGKIPPDGTIGLYEADIPGSQSEAGIKARKEVGLTVDHLVNGYFRRDLMRAIAKPGWFEE